MRISTYRFSIEWGDCDPAGIVYFPNFFRYFDNATTRLFTEALGAKKAEWMARYGAAGLPMADIQASFRAPAAFGDEVAVETRVTRLGRSSVGLEHRMFRGEQLLVEAQAVRVWVVRKGNAISASELPPEVRQRLGGENPKLED